MKPYTVVVSDLRMCMKEDNLSEKTTTKGDNSRGTNICGGREGDILCDLTHSSIFLGDRLGAHCLIYLVSCSRKCVKGKLTG